MVRLASLVAVVLTLVASACGTDNALDPGSAPPGEAEASSIVSEPLSRAVVDFGGFSSTIEHPYLPLAEGTTWTWEVSTAEGSIDRLEMVVTDERLLVMGVEAVVVRVTLFVAGEIEERTDSWYAQDVDGTVWLFGEIDESYEDGSLVETTEWAAGVDGAQAGIVMHAIPAIDKVYREGFLAGEVEERGRVIAIDATVLGPTGTYENVWVIENWSDLEPDVVERKYYAAGVGLVYLDSDHPDADSVELIAARDR